MKTHQQDFPRFKFACCLCLIPKHFTCIRSWLRHVRQLHGSGDGDGDGTSSSSEHERDPQDDFVAHQVGSLPCQTETSEGSRFMVASFMHSLRKHHLSEAACVQVAKSVEDIGKRILHEYENGSGDQTCLSALQEFQSNSRYERFVEDHLPYVEPETVVVGRKESGKEDSYQYVSLKSQLRNLALLPQLRSCIFEDEGETSSKIADVFDGTAHSQRKKNTMYLAISYDDFEVANPLGSAAGVHKLAALHFSLLNVPVEHRSKVDSLHLLVLSLSSVVAEYGWSVVLERLLDDLKELYTTGMEVNIDGKMVTVYAELVFLPCDNLAVHNIAGFVANFSSAKHPCRFCLATPEEFQDNFTEDHFVQRTADLYQRQLQQVEDSGFQAEVIAETGVKCRCVFSELPYFNVTCSFPPDIGHDLLEGVVPYTLSLVLEKIVCVKKYISLAELNELILAFPWDSRDNRPMRIRQVKGRIRIRQSASQCWALLRYLPLLLGDFIPLDCVEWSLLTGLCCIVERTFAWSFSRGDVEFLKFKIADWLEDLRHAFPGFRLKPKFHYMTHYGSQILKHGPLRCCWTMRFESKYSFLKGTIKENKNFRNIARTVARKHQLHMAFVVNSASFLCSVGVQGFKLMDEWTFPAWIGQKLQNEGYEIGQRAQIDGICYVSGDVVLLSGSEVEDYGFGRICAVCALKGSLSFVVRVMTSDYDSLTNSYEVFPSSEVLTAARASLQDFHPLHTVTMENGRCFVVLNYHV